MFCFFAFNLPSQINVKIDVKDNCSGSFTINKSELIDKFGNELIKNPETGYYELKADTGYFISLNLTRNNSTYLINHAFEVVSTTEFINEIIYLPKLMKGSFDNFYDEKFYICEEICNGYVEDFYQNGNIRIKGKFNQGLPQGKLYYYSEDGELLKIEKYNKKGKFKKTKK